MTAYGALISLANTTQNFLKSYCRSPFHPILEAAYSELEPLQEVLERLDSSNKRKGRNKVNALDSRIKQKLWDFEDLLDDALFTHFPSSVCAAADSFIQTLKDMKEEYIYELDHMPDQDDDDNGDGSGNQAAAAAAAISSSTSGGMNKSKMMIGLSDEFEEVKFLIYHYAGPLIMSYAIVGMAGLGKTTLAMKIYQDPEIQRYFDCRVWITVGRKYDPNRAVSLATRMQGGDKCLVVLDDVWETGVLPIFLASLMEVKDGRFIRILITAQSRNVIRDFHKSIKLIDSSIQVSTNKVLRFLNEEESTDLLCAKVFGEGEICPPELEKAAAKIAKNCEGLPLMILAVAKRLSNNRDPDYWNEVAEERNSVFTDSYEEISNVLFPSYEYLPPRLKMPFLYLGVFPRDYDIPMSKILNMLAADGWLLSPNKLQSSKDLATEYLEELCMSYNLVLFQHRSIHWIQTDGTGILKTCCLHSSWGYLCRREARKNKFFQVLKKLVDAIPHSQEEEEEEEEEEDLAIKGQRGLCLENNLLFGLKDFCNPIKSYCASTSRFLLFYGPYHQYPTPIDAIGFKLLREVDALQLCFYTFPAQILTLFQLRYLALTCNDEIPANISKLSKLQTLIIHPHSSIIKCHTPPSFIPIEIWDMLELEHIEILGKSLRASNNANAYLQKLKTLVGLNTDIGTISEWSNRIFFLKKLGVQMELTPYDTNTSILDMISGCFNCVSMLVYLKTLRCSIMNPVHVPLARYPVAAPRSLVLPKFLFKLHMSGMGFPWEYMTDAIASLPFLQVLKLRSNAFRGPKWEIQEGSFLELQYLVIEDSDLVEWRASSGSFPLLNNLSLKHCYKLRELDWSPDVSFARIDTTRKHGSNYGISDGSYFRSRSTTERRRQKVSREMETES